MQFVEEGIVLLMAAQSSDVSKLLHYTVHFSLGLIPLVGNSLSSSFKWFISTKLGPVFVYQEAVASLFIYRFIISGWEIIIFEKNEVLVVSSKTCINFS